MEVMEKLVPKCVNWKMVKKGTKIPIKVTLKSSDCIYPPLSILNRRIEVELKCNYPNPSMLNTLFR